MTHTTIPRKKDDSSCQTSSVLDIFATILDFINHYKLVEIAPYPLSPSAITFYRRANVAYLCK